MNGRIINLARECRYWEEPMYVASSLILVKCEFEFYWCVHVVSTKYRKFQINFIEVYA